MNRSLNGAEAEPKPAQQDIGNWAIKINEPCGRVQLPVAILEGIPEWTLQFWVRSDFKAIPSPMPLYYYRTVNFYLVLVNTGVDNLELWLHGASMHSRRRIVAWHLFEPGRWAQVTLVIRTNSAQLALNGVPLPPVQFANSIEPSGIATAHELGHGPLFGSQESCFLGMFDEIALWRRALTQSEIRRNFQNRPDPNDPDLIAWWSFEDRKTTDASGHQYPLTFQGEVRFVQAELPRLATNKENVVIVGQAIDTRGRPLFPAVIELIQDESVIDAVLSDPLGRFQFFGPYRTGNVTIRGRSPTGFSEPLALPSVRAEWTSIKLMFKDQTPATSRMADFSLAVSQVLLRHPYQALRLSPNWLIQLKDSLKHATDALIYLIQSPDLLQRRAATYILAQTESASLQALQALMEATHSADPITRAIATLAMQQIDVPTQLKAVYEKKTTATSRFYIGLLLPLALIHIMLFVLQPTNRANLYYSIFIFSTCGLTWILSSNFYGTAGAISAVLAFLFLGLIVISELFGHKRWILTWIFALLVGLTIILTLAFADKIQPGILGFLPSGPARYPHSALIVVPLVFAAFLLIAMPLEMLRLLLTALVQRRPGAGLVTLGFVLLLISTVLWPISYFSLFAGKLEPRTFNFCLHLFPNAGITFFALSASIQLARDFGNAYRGLRQAMLEIERQRQHLEQAKQQAEQACEEARRANEAKSRFLASMSHELRTPLNAIIGYSEMLEEEALEKGMIQFATDLHKIRTAALHQLSLIDDVLDLARIEAGHIRLELANFSIAELVNEVISTVELLAKQNGNQLSFSCPESVGSMYADPIKVRQILYNLLSNACKYTQNGQVSLRVETKVGPNGTEMILFVVSDSGCGIKAEELPLIFEPFVRASTTSPQQKGSGLGLAISRTFCRIMGGDLLAESVYGKGSTFTAMIPRCVETNRAKEPPTQSKDNERLETVEKQLTDAARAKQTYTSSRGQ